MMGRRRAWARGVWSGLLLLLLVGVPATRGLQAAQAHAFHSASEAELTQALPARAPVEKERIETEMRTASGFVDDHGHVTAGVVLITAGYSADGKYSHYLLVGTRLRLGTLLLQPGKYVFGWQRVAEGLEVHLYEASNGAERGTVVARLLPAGTRVEPFHLSAPGEHAVMQIGRFGVPYQLAAE